MYEFQINQNNSFGNSTYITKINFPTAEHEEYLSIIFFGFFVLHVSHQKATKTNPIELLIPIILTIPTLCLTFILSIILFVIKTTVDVYLRLKHGVYYWKMLDSADAVWAVEDVSKSVINVLVVIERKSSDPEQLLDEISEIFTEKVFRYPENHQKLTSTRSSAFGFAYYLRNQLKVKDCVRILNPNNEDSLIELISSCSNKDLPLKNSALWEILIISKPVVWTTSNGYNLPVLLRFSHILGDGLSLMNYFSKIFTNTSIKPLVKNIKNEGRNVLINKVKIALFAPSVLCYQNFLRKNDENILHGPRLSGEKLLVYAVEKTEGLVNVVKTIKRRVVEVTFVDVILTAISKVLDEYHQIKGSSAVPHFLTSAITAHFSGPDFDQVDLRNQFSIAMLDLPMNTRSKSLLQRLFLVNRSTKKLRESLDIQVNHLLLTKLCGILPQPLLRKCLNTDQLTMTLSNVPGTGSIHILKDSKVQDIIFFTPHRGTTGLGFTILTYDNRFQLGLSVDKAIIALEKDAQYIIDGVFKNIKLLKEEVDRNLTTKW